MLSSDPSISICLVVDEETPAWRATLASALTACPALPHEVIVLMRSSAEPFAALGSVAGLRVVRYGPSTETPSPWHALSNTRGASITLVGEPGVISRTLPERAHRRLIKHTDELIAPRSRTLPAARGYWEYGAELAPDLTSTALSDPPTPWSELPAVRALCASFSRARLDQLLERCGDAWATDLLPEELSLRWWLLGGAIVCDTASSFTRASVAGTRQTTVDWGQQRLTIAALHLSDTRRERLQRYLEGVVPNLEIAAPGALLETRAKLLKVRERDDDWYAARFGFDVFDSAKTSVAVGG